MGKLFRLREWLTLPEAAKHLSGVFEEAVTDADVLRLVLDGHLTISANFLNGVLARRGKLVLHDEAFPPEREFVPLEQRIDDIYEGFQGVALNGDCGFALDLSEPNLTHLFGVIDLSLMGAEIFDLEHQFQLLTGGSEVTIPSPEGVIVCFKDEIFQLQLPPDNWEKAACIDYHEPMESLPGDAVLVVRTEALRDFEKSISNQPTQAVRDESLIAVIAALLAQWPSGKPPTGKDLEKAAQSVGLKISDDTIRKALKAAREIAPGLSA